MTGKLIDRNPDIPGGTPAFSGTKVPVRILPERLEAGDRIDEFLKNHPAVTHDQATGAPEYAKATPAGEANEAAA